MASMMTLCELCKNTQSDVFRFKPAPTNSTTQKSKKCDICRRTYPPDLLTLYIATGKGR